MLRDVTVGDEGVELSGIVPNDGAEEVVDTLQYGSVVAGEVLHGQVRPLAAQGIEEHGGAEAAFGPVSLSLTPTCRRRNAVQMQWPRVRTADTFHQRPRNICAEPRLQVPGLAGAVNRHSVWCEAVDNATNSAPEPLESSFCTWRNS
jgi:hypothetical protein